MTRAKCFLIEASSAARYLTFLSFVTATQPLRPDKRNPLFVMRGQRKVVVVHLDHQTLRAKPASNDVLAEVAI